MRTVIIALAALACAVHAQDNYTVEDAIAELEEAYRGDDETVIEPVIRDAAKFSDKRVVDLVARGLRSSSLAVRKAAIDTLGRMDSKDALEELHSLYRRDVNLRKNPTLYALLLQSIGRHGDKSSLSILADYSHKYLTLASGRARIYGIANIRDDRSVEELIQASRKAGGKKRGSGVESEWRGVFAKDFHAAIHILTGEDYGRGRNDLEAWYREWKKKPSPRVKRVRPRVPPEVSDLYEAFWNKPYYKNQKRKPKTTLHPPIEIVENPTPEQERLAAEAIDEAFKSKDDDLIAAAIEAHGGVVSNKVVRQVARALRSDDPRVRMHGIIALGWMPHPDALRQLHRMYRREKKLGKDDEAAVRGAA